MIKVQLGSVRASSLKTRRTTPLLLAGLLAFGIGIVGHNKVSSVQPLSVGFDSIAAITVPVVERIAELPSVQAAASAAAEVQEMAAAAVASTPEYFSREVELAAGENFLRLLTKSDVATEEAQSANAALRKAYDLRKLKGGLEVTLSFARTGTDEKLTSVTFMPEPTKEIVMTRNDAGVFTAQVNTIPLERHRIAARGVVRGSLYEAGARQGVPRSIMAAVIRAYSHAIDFQRDVKSGDKFEVLYDQPTSRDGKPVGQGVIIYAALEVAGKVKPLYRVTFGDGTVDYFDERGQSVKRSLLRTPVDGARMTSGFGMRVHPILGYSKMHKGTDFGAPIGTPILAAGSGTIVEIGFKGAYGRYIRLKHNNRTYTAYAHMSRFARDLYKGARVDQGDVIGFVGVSGRTTGPHLHFELIVDGRNVNPMSVSLPTGRALEGSALTQFKKGQSTIKNEFSTLLEKDKATEVEPVSVPVPPAPAVKPQRIEAEAPATSTKKQVQDMRQFYQRVAMRDDLAFNK